MIALELEVTTLWELEGAPLIDAASVEALVAHTLRSEGVGGAWDITVVLSTDQRLRTLHLGYMGLDTPTDIMTFPYADGSSWPEHQGPLAESGGDIVISVERAAAQANLDGWDTTSEVRFLICHGVLHLLGWDDAEPGHREAMLERQRSLLRSFPALI